MAPRLSGQKFRMVASSLQYWIINITIYIIIKAYHIQPRWLQFNDSFAVELSKNMVFNACFESFINIVSWIKKNLKYYKHQDNELGLNDV